MNRLENIHSISHLEQSAEHLSNTLEKAMFVICKKRLRLVRKRLDEDENAHAKSPRRLMKPSTQDALRNSKTRVNMSQSICLSKTQSRSSINGIEAHGQINHRHKSAVTSLEDMERLAKKIKMYRQRQRDMTQPRGACANT